MSTTDVSHFSDITKLTTEPDGSFKRAPAAFRDHIEKGGRFEPEVGRYRLYVSYACPWATRTLIVRKLKGLEDIIPLTVVSPRLGPDGWPFASKDAFPGAEDDPLYQSGYIKDLYLRANPDYNGRFTVPFLWDTKEHTLVNNESSEIIRMFNSAFNELLPREKAEVDLYPAKLAAEIDELNEWVYDGINNGVYKTGFATSQAVYEKAVHLLFDSLDRVEKILGEQEYLVGDTMTEADVKLFVTIVRFDPVYFGHFKCNLRSIRHGYPAINAWLKKLYWTRPEYKDSTNFTHIKTGVYWSQVSINPTRIVPVGPIPDIEPL